MFKAETAAVTTATATTTALQQGNRAWRAGQVAEAIRHYALGLLDTDNQQTPHGPITDQLAYNLLLARKRYRRQRQASIQTSGKLQVVVTCWSLSENPAGRAYTLASLYKALADSPDQPETRRDRRLEPLPRALEAAGIPRLLPPGATAARQPRLRAHPRRQRPGPRRRQCRAHHPGGARMAATQRRPTQDRPARRAICKARIILATRRTSGGRALSTGAERRGKARRRGIFGINYTVPIILLA